MESKAFNGEETKEIIAENMFTLQTIQDEPGRREEKAQRPHPPAACRKHKLQQKRGHKPKSLLPALLPCLA